MPFSIPTNLPFRFPAVAFFTPKTYFRRQSAAPLGLIKRYSPFSSNRLSGLPAGLASRIADLMGMSVGIWGTSLQDCQVPQLVPLPLECCHWRLAVNVDTFVPVLNHF